MFQTCELLNTPIVFNIPSAAAFNENLPPITASGTATNTITFQKFGEGINPQLRLLVLALKMTTLAYALVEAITLRWME